MKCKVLSISAYILYVYVYMFHIPLLFPKGDNSDFKPAGLYNHSFAQVYLLLEIFIWILGCYFHKTIIEKMMRYWSLSLESWSVKAVPVKIRMPVFNTSTYGSKILKLLELLKLKKVGHWRPPYPLKKVAFHPFQVIALMPNSFSTTFFIILDQKTRHYISRHWWGNRKLQLRKS